MRYLTNAVKKRSIAFLISDFIGSGYSDALKIASRKHDMVAIRVHDPLEAELPNVGLLPLTDAETGELVWVDTSDAKVRTKLKAEALRAEDEMRSTFRRSGVDMAEVRTDGSYVKPLMSLFKRRGK
jgi:hypothetical protein